MKTQEIKRDTTEEKDGHKQLMRDRGMTTTVVKEHTDMKTATQHRPVNMKDGVTPEKEHMMKIEKGAADMTQAEDMKHPAHPQSGTAFIGSDYQMNKKRA